MSDTWDVEDGVGQVAVLSGLLFNVLVNGLLAVELSTSESASRAQAVQAPCKAEFQCAQMTW